MGWERIGRERTEVRVIGEGVEKDELY